MTAANQNHWDCRSGILTMQSPQAGLNPILRIGDSLTEQMWIGFPTLAFQTEINGHNANVLNAGFMGIKTGEIAPYRDYALSLCNPWAVIFQCGTNDALSSLPFDLWVWKAAFEQSVIAITQHPGVQKTIILSIPPVRDANCGFDQSRINAMNNEIEEICTRYPTVYLDRDPYFMCQSTGYARPNHLLDCAHMGGYMAFTEAWLEYSLCSGAPLAAPPAPC